MRIATIATTRLPAQMSSSFDEERFYREVLNGNAPPVEENVPFGIVRIIRISHPVSFPSVSEHPSHDDKSIRSPHRGTDEKLNGICCSPAPSFPARCFYKDRLKNRARSMPHYDLQIRTASPRAPDSSTISKAGSFQLMAHPSPNHNPESPPKGTGDRTERRR